MRFSIEREALLPLVERVAKIPATTSTIPILMYCMISVNRGNISIIGTDLEREMVVTMQSIDCKDGSACVPAEFFYQTVKRARAKSMIVVEETSDGRVTVTAGKSAFSFGSLPASDYPRLRDDGYSTQFEIESADLMAMIARTKSAMSDE